MRKIIALLGIVFLVGLLFVPLVSAAYVCPAAWNPGTGSSYEVVRAVHPAPSLQKSEEGMMFTANATAYLYNVTFSLAKYGSPNVLLQPVLAASGGGTVGSSAVRGVELQLGSYINSTTLAATALNVTFQFDGSYQLQSGTDYYIGLYVSEGTIDTTNYIRFYEASSFSASYNSVGYTNSGYAADTDDDFFIVNGDSSAGAYATPTPTPPSSSGGSDETLQYWSDMLMPWLPVMLVILVPAFLMLKYLGQFGFFVGLNIGVLVAYVVLGHSYVPLWGVVLVGVLDIALVLMRR